MTLIVLEKGNNTTKTKQHNTTHPKELFFKEKLATSGGIPTHDTHTLGNALTN